MGSIRVCLVLLAISLLLGCVTEGNASGGTNPASVHKGKPGNAIEICGEKYTLGDIVAHPAFRQSLKQFVQLQQVYAEAAKLGVAIDDAVVDEELNKQKEQMTASGESWEEILSMQGMTEDELRSMIKTQMTFEKMIDAKMELSDETLQQYWDENKDQVLNAHIQMNFLPESERASLTFEDCKETITKTFRMREGQKYQQEIVNDITLNATLDLNEVLDEEAAALAYAQILGNDQERIREEQAAAEEINNSEETGEEGSTVDELIDTENITDEKETVSTEVGSKEASPEESREDNDGTEEPTETK